MGQHLKMQRRCPKLFFGIEPECWCFLKGNLWTTPLFTCTLIHCSWQQSETLWRQRPLTQSGSHHFYSLPFKFVPNRRCHANLALGKILKYPSSTPGPVRATPPRHTVGTDTHLPEVQGLTAEHSTSCALLSKYTEPSPHYRSTRKKRVIWKGLFALVFSHCCHSFRLSLLFSLLSLKRRQFLDNWWINFSVLNQLEEKV